MSTPNAPYASGPPPPHGEQAPKANPLIRTSDRVEAWFRRLLIALLVAGMPLAAIGAGTAAYDAAMRTVQTQSAERTHVSAKLISDSKDVHGETRQQAEVRWTESDGTARTAIALVEPDTPKGATVGVWVDRDGDITSPPLTEPQAATNAGFTGGLTAIGVLAAAWAARVVLRRVLDRRRYAQWDAEWAAVEPDWAARFRG